MVLRDKHGKIVGPEGCLARALKVPVVVGLPYCIWRRGSSSMHEMVELMNCAYLADQALGGPLASNPSSDLPYNNGRNRAATSK